MRESKILPQVSHLWVVLSALAEGWRSFLRACFSSAAADVLVSPSLRSVCRAAQLRAISCQVFPISEVDVQSLHISLAGVTVAELQAAYTSLAGGKLAVEDVLRYSTILHMVDMAKPSKPTLAKQSEHGG